MRKILEFTEKVFTIASLILYSGGPLTVIISGGESEGVAAAESYDNSLIKLLFLLVYTITLFLLIVRWKKVLYLLSKDKFIWVLVGVSVASIFWSSSQSMTIARDLALVGTSLFGLYFATRYSLEEQIQLLSSMFGIVIILSFLFAIALPKYGIMDGIHAGAWRGIYNHKNVLGKVMVTGVIIFLLRAISSQKNRLLLWCGFSLSLILILLSTSKGSLINVLTLLAAFAAYHILRWRYVLMLPSLTTIAMVGAGLQLWLTANTEVLLSLMGKDATLTGRTELWASVLDMIWKRPLLGYGFGAFWSGAESESASIIDAEGWSVPNSHNGLLDLGLNLGILGVLIFGIGFLTTSLKALAWVRLSRTAEQFWPIMYITYFVLANLSETTLMIQNDIFWVLYVAVALSVLISPERQFTDSLNRDKLLSKYS